MTLRLTLRGVRCLLPGRAGGEPVDLELGSARAVALLGGSGEGKSLLCKLVLGMSPPAPVAWEGALELDGRPATLSTLAGLRGARIRVVPQGGRESLIPGHSLRRHLDLLLPSGEHAAARENMEALGLAPDDRLLDAQAPALSEGMIRRFLLALATAGSPDLLVLDEPGAGLDAGSRSGLVALVRARILDRGAGLLLATHDLELAGKLAGTFVLVRDLAPVAVAEGVRDEGPFTSLVQAQRHLETAPARVATARAGGGSDVLRAEDLRVAFGPAHARRPILRGAHLQVAAGELVALTAPSGEGKTVLATLLLLLRRPDAGVVRWSGVDVTAASRGAVQAQRARHQGLLQHTGANLPPHMTLKELLRETVAHVGGGIEEAEALAQELGLGLLLDRRSRHLSGGEQRRAGLARVLAARPAFVVLDEPDAGLDATAVCIALDAVRSRVDRGMGCLLVTHNQSVARRWADRSVALHEGVLWPMTDRTPTPHEGVLHEG